MKTKICTKCGEEKLLSEYHKDSRAKSGVQSQCKSCKNKWYLNNDESVKERSKKWKEDNPERNRYLNKLSDKRRRKKISKYNRDRYNNDALVCLSGRVRSLIKQAIKRGGYAKNTKTEEILGCSYEDFIQHIESQFKPWMTWDNRGEWELDHIIPLSSYEDEDELIKLNHYTNLQPMRAELNRKKSDSYLEEDKQRFLEQLSRTLKIKQ